MKKIVITSDKYSFCLDGFQKLISKYWTDENSEFTILGFNKPDSEIKPNFEFISLGEGFSDSSPWHVILNPYFEKLEEDYFFLFFEDHFLIDYLKKDYFDRAKKIMEEDNSISKIRVHPPYVGDSLPRYDDLFSYAKTGQESYYPTSLRPAIWRKDFFLKMLNHPALVRSPHEFENYNNRLSWTEKVLIPNEIFYADLDAMRRGEPNPQTFNSGKIDMDYYEINMRSEDLSIFEDLRQKWSNK
jgi:hypothetical protein